MASLWIYGKSMLNSRAAIWKISYQLSVLVSAKVGDVIVVLPEHVIGCHYSSVVGHISSKNKISERPGC